VAAGSRIERCTACKRNGRLNTSRPSPSWPRNAICETRNLAIAYVDEEGHCTQRTTWPTGMAYHVHVTFVGAWSRILTVYGKGQVTLREDLLKHLGVQPGEKIIVDKLPDGRIEIKAWLPTGKITEVFDFLKQENGPSLSIAEISEAARRGWAGRR
jgi:bifunctional DNA-binding transcriptional regulator/antitoxin component of YhaV-PrlF toxin-antitoxin module